MLEVVEQYKQRLLRTGGKWVRTDWFKFRIHTPCFRLWLEQGNFTCFSVRFTEEGVKIICPRNVDFSLPEVQRLVRNAIIRAMRKMRKNICHLFYPLCPNSIICHLNVWRLPAAREDGEVVREQAVSIFPVIWCCCLPIWWIMYCHTNCLIPRKWITALVFGSCWIVWQEGELVALRAELRRFNTDF